jgi:methanogen homocitrate synthase
MDPWIGPKWISSRHNFNDEVLAQFQFPKNITIYDVTLRDGEQMPGIVFRKDERIRIAKALDDIGIPRIEVGLPGSSKEDFEGIKEIVNLGLNAQIGVFSRARKDDIDLAVQCGVDSIVISLPSSTDMIERGFRWTKSKVKELALETTSYAKEQGLRVTYFPVDTTRGDPEFVKDLVTSVVNESHVDSVALVDTFGCASPQAISHIVKMLRIWVDVPIEAHCHNELGLATANSIAALAAGAEIVHTTINGIGERGGMTPTEELAVALRILHNQELDLKYNKFYETSKIVEKATGLTLPPYKPVVGKTAFAYEAGIPVMITRRLITENMLQACLSYLPEFVGNKFQVVLGKKSGKHGIKQRLENKKIDARDDQIDEILLKVKELSIRNKRAVTDEEFDEISNSVLQIQ